MSLAKAPEAEMYEVQYLALMFGAALLLGAALYTAVRLWHRRGAVLLSIGLAVAALGPLVLVGSMWLELSRGWVNSGQLVVGLLEITAAVMIVLAVPYLIDGNRPDIAEVEGTA